MIEIPAVGATSLLSPPARARPSELLRAFFLAALAFVALAALAAIA